MAYDKDKIYKEALNKAKGSRFYFVEDVVAAMGISKTTFYEFFPSESAEMNAIKNLLRKNKSSDKETIRDKLMKSDKAAELVPLYKLISTPEERKKLSSSYIDHTTNEKDIPAASVINYNALDENTLKDIIANSEEPEEEKPKEGKS